MLEAQRNLKHGIVVRTGGAINIRGFEDVDGTRTMRTVPRMTPEQRAAFKAYLLAKRAELDAAELFQAGAPNFREWGAAREAKHQAWLKAVESGIPAYKIS